MHTVRCSRRKDLLLRVLRKMKAVHGSAYHFHPDSYMLPTEYTKFIREFTRLQQQQQQQRQKQIQQHHQQRHQQQRHQQQHQQQANQEPTCITACRVEGNARGGKQGGNGGGDGGDETGALWILKPSDSSRYAFHLPLFSAFVIFFVILSCLNPSLG